MVGVAAALVRYMNERLKEMEVVKVDGSVMEGKSKADYYEAYAAKKRTLPLQGTCTRCGRRVMRGETAYVVHVRLKGTKWAHKQYYCICTDCAADLKEGVE